MSGDVLGLRLGLNDCPKRFQAVSNQRQKDSPSTRPKRGIHGIPSLIIESLGRSTLDTGHWTGAEKSLAVYEIEI